MAGALILDFDGLVIDTETADFEAWRSIYDDYGVDLPLERWLAAIGTDGTAFDPFAFLEQATGRPLHEPEVRELRRTRRDAAREWSTLRPGVRDWLRAARRRGLAVGIASSSPLDWVDGHLRRVSLRDDFDVLVTVDQVSRAKPAPDLYERAVQRLGATRRETLAVEDSPNGIAAARAAGLFCVAVPGPMTRDLDFAAADLVLESLADRSLDEVLRQLLGRD